MLKLNFAYYMFKNKFKKNLFRGIPEQYDIMSIKCCLLLKKTAFNQFSDLRTTLLNIYIPKETVISNKMILRKQLNCTPEQQYFSRKKIWQNVYQIDLPVI